MKTLKQQVEDWKKVKDLCDKVPKTYEPHFKENVQEFYDAVRSYYFTHNRRFDYHNQPE